MLNAPLNCTLRQLLQPLKCDVWCRISDPICPLPFLHVLRCLAAACSSYLHPLVLQAYVQFVLNCWHT